ncbi:hypothetical protein GA0115255_111629, partial [Streptomyces sp. Ncost-T6T-2b]
MRSSANFSVAAVAAFRSPSPVYASMRTGYTLQVFGCCFFTVSPHRFAARKSCRALARAASP